MKKLTFREVMDYCVSTYGVESGEQFFDNGYDNVYFRCSECDEPIYEGDWAYDPELQDGCCPVCGQRLVDVDVDVD